MKGQKVPLSNQWEMEPGFRDFLRALSGSSSAPACSGTLSVHDINWHRKTDFITSLGPVRSDEFTTACLCIACRCEGLNRKPLSVLAQSSRALFWL